MRALRSSRWLRVFAALGALLAPGTGGSALQAAHPCAVAAPWLAEGATTADASSVAGAGQRGDGHGRVASASHAPQGHDAHHASGEHPADPPSDSHAPHGGTCHCIGSCVAAVALTAAGTPIVPVLVDAAPSSAGFAAVHARLAARLRELLPPATAPPIA
jgi:hypothetical protein